MDTQNKSKGSSLASSIVAGLLGLLVGSGLGYGLKPNNTATTTTNNQASVSEQTQQASQPTTNTKAADLRVLLNGLQKQHVDLASTAVRNGFDGSPAFPASAAELGKNTKALSDAVGSVYGSEAGSQFGKIWESHIGFFVDYTTAAKAGDKAKMDQAVQNLNGYVDAISTFFYGANPNLPKEAVSKLVTEHVMLLKGAVDTYGAKDFAGSFDNQSKAYNQIGTIADNLSGAIVKQKPESFK